MNRSGVSDLEVGDLPASIIMTLELIDWQHQGNFYDGAERMFFVWVFSSV